MFLWWLYFLNLRQVKQKLPKIWWSEILQKFMYSHWIVCCVVLWWWHFRYFECYFIHLVVVKFIQWLLFNVIYSLCLLMLTMSMKFCISLIHCCQCCILFYRFYYFLSSSLILNRGYYYYMLRNFRSTIESFLCLWNILCYWHFSNKLKCERYCLRWIPFGILNC